MVLDILILSELNGNHYHLIEFIMAASHHVVPSQTIAIMGELLFQMHGSLLAGPKQKINPRAVQNLVAWLTLLKEEGSLPQEFRELCECLCDDWTQLPAPRSSSYRAEMVLCAA